MKNNEVSVENIKKILSKLTYEELEKLMIRQAKKNMDLKEMLIKKEEE